MTSRQKTDLEHRNWFKIEYEKFLENNKGYLNILDYLNGLYGCDRDYWAKIARKCGLKFMKRKGVYFMKV